MVYLFMVKDVLKNANVASGL